MSSRLKSRKLNKPKPFRFFDLPPEIRLRVYETLLSVDTTIDLGSANYYKVAPLLELFLVSHQMHEEAYRVFYGVNTFRIFSTDGKFMHSKKPLLGRLPISYRSAISTLEMRLGPGWTKPPATWKLTEPMCSHAQPRMLKIFVELDPEDSSIWREWMRTPTSYTEFSVQRLTELLEQFTSIVEVRFDAFQSVQKTGPLVSALASVCAKRQVEIEYGCISTMRQLIKPLAPLPPSTIDSLSTAMSQIIISSTA